MFSATLYLAFSVDFQNLQQACIFFVHYRRFAIKKLFGIDRNEIQNLFDHLNHLTTFKTKYCHKVNIFIHNLMRGSQTRIAMNWKSFAVYFLQENL
jgi:hypothetical protein